MLFPALRALERAARLRRAISLANGIRNVWTFAIIFCGHFPEGVRVYREDETRDESRGAWYVRQLQWVREHRGRAALFHVLSGHLSHQIEHHLFPDIPALATQRWRRACARSASGTGRSTTRAASGQLGSVAKGSLEERASGQERKRFRDDARQSSSRRELMCSRHENV